MEGESRDGGGVDLELSDLAPIEPWFGYGRADATAAPSTGTPEDRVPVTVQTVAAGRWDQAHVDRLLLTTPTADRDTAGLVPVAAVIPNESGDQTVVSLRTDAPRFQERLDFRTPPSWNEGAGVALAAALAVEKGHSLGLRHGALHPRDVIVAGSELAVAGMGLSLGGTPDPTVSMAPEVARSGVPTVAGDVYSLGRLLDAGTSGDPNTPAEIAALVADATTEEIGERIPTALEFAERLSEVGAGVMRSYTPMSFADSRLLTGGTGFENVAPTVVTTELAETSSSTPVATEESRSAVGKALPWFLAAGLAGVIGFGLWAAATSGEGESATPSTQPTSITTTTATTTTVSTTSDPSTTLDSSTTSSASTTAPPSTSTTAPPTTSTTSTTTTEPTTTLPTPPEVPAVPASEAGLELVHGLSEPAVDVYVDGSLLVGGFAPGEIAGPLNLTAGSYDIELFSAVGSPAQSSEARTDTPLLAQALPITGQPEAIVVASDADDGVLVRSFADDVSPIPPGQGRLAIRNPSSSTIVVTVDPVRDGAALERQAVSPGAVLSLDLPSGDYQLFVAEEDGSPLLATVVSNPEGELTSATFLRDGSPRLILQRIGDLGSPPDGIPTGTDGLLPGSDDPTAGLLIAALGAIGLFAVVGRERLLASGRP